MKKTLQNTFSFIAALFLFAACDVSPAEMVVSTAPEGIEISNPFDEYDSYEGHYKVAAFVKNTSDKDYDAIQLTTVYKNAAGDSIGSAIGGKALAAGDSTVIETFFLFTDKEKLPAKVEISAQEM